jgi:hypothetical protein
MEIYNESISDLLHVNAQTGEPEPSGDMKIIADDPIKGAVIAGLKEVVITSPGEALDCLTQGEATRHVAGTTMNARSSRSHCIFRLVIESKMTPEALREEKERITNFGPNDDDSDDDMVQLGQASKDEEHVKVSYLNLVDLAGSERQEHTGAAGATLKEGAAINKSLSALAEVISKLADMSVRLATQTAQERATDRKARTRKRSSAPASPENRADAALAVKMVSDLATVAEDDDDSEDGGEEGGGGAGGASSLRALRSILDKGKQSRAGGRVAMDHIPYRNSKLTRILKQSLGGNTFTSILLCVSPETAYVLHILEYERMY